MKMISFWKTPVSNVLLSTEDIHIWRVGLDSATLSIAELNQILSVDERTRANRYRFAQDRNRFVVRRGILRTILGHYLGVAPSQVRFRYEIHGKPVLADGTGNSNIRFNLSHSDGIALLAFTRNYKIGVDIERIRDISEMDQIAASFFSEGEYAVFRSLPKDKKKEAFFDCWTRKEAFVKATGDGLSYPLDKFEVSLMPDEPARLLRLEGATKKLHQWSIQELKPALDFTAALAVKRRNWRLHYWKWSNIYTKLYLNRKIS